MQSARGVIVEYFQNLTQNVLHEAWFYIDSRWEYINY